MMRYCVYWVLHSTYPDEWRTFYWRGDEKDHVNWWYASWRMDGRLRLMLAGCHFHLHVFHLHCSWVLKITKCLMVMKFITPCSMQTIRKEWIFGFSCNLNKALICMERKKKVMGFQLKYYQNEKNEFKSCNNRLYITE